MGTKKWREKKERSITVKTPRATTVPLLSDHLTKIPICFSISQIAISETFRKQPPPVSTHLSLTSMVVAYGKFHSIVFEK